MPMGSTTSGPRTTRFFVADQRAAKLTPSHRKTFSVFQRRPD
jgi:hypothetical protein